MPGFALLVGPGATSIRLDLVGFLKKLLIYVETQLGISRPTIYRAKGKKKR
jgi:hypothetical protein